MFGLPDAKDIAATLAAVYRSTEQLRRKCLSVEEMAESEPDMLKLKQAIEKLGGKVE